LEISTLVFDTKILFSFTKQPKQLSRNKPGHVRVKYCIVKKRPGDILFFFYKQSENFLFSIAAVRISKNNNCAFFGLVFSVKLEK